jgi:hypothetical protein
MGAQGILARASKQIRPGMFPWPVERSIGDVERLNVTGVIVSAAFILGDKDHGIVPIRRVQNHIHDLLGEAFEKIEL